ncbi:hypothetical protein JQ594_00725 [Bradyrhizobium manausense]|uniref:hypothetical protein n=1 Tax=Bradyrhizobium manausense TaxID=989370 RepID=UPI001BAD97D8|nr:hypothetical protein [Bradyrhizobium manausense]MBR0684425.1 hypothetical protein [Bradyrhizobium manausense]
MTQQDAAEPATGSRWWTVGKWLAVAFVGLAVLSFAVFYVRPFEHVPEPTADDVATAWNKSIGRLGIQPVYPPSEDLYVGDLWAVVADSEDTPLLGKSVRVARLDLKSDIIASAPPSIFADTAEIDAAKKYRPSDRLEAQQANVGDRITLSLTAFPGIAIVHSKSAAASAGQTGWFGARRDETQNETIRINTAESYGVPTVNALLKLDDWCSATATKLFCTDAFVRKLVSYAVSDKVLATKEGAYTTRLQLVLVTRVFLTRELEQGASSSTQGTAAAQLAADPTQTSSENDAGKPEGRKALSPTNSAGARVSSSRGDSSEISVKQVFQRPLVFGFRGITIALAQAKPSEARP